MCIRDRLHHGDAGVLAQAPVELAVAHVDGQHPGGAALEQPVDEPARGTADVADVLAVDGHAELGHGVVELVAAAGDEAWPRGHAERRGGVDHGSRLVGDLVGDPDLAGQDGAPRLGAGREEPPGDEQRIEPLAHSAAYLTRARAAGRSAAAAATARGVRPRSSSSRVRSPCGTNASGKPKRTTGTLPPTCSSTALPNPPARAFSSTVTMRRCVAASRSRSAVSSGFTKRASTTVGCSPCACSSAAASRAMPTPVPMPMSATSRPSSRTLASPTARAVSYTHLRAHETVLDLVCRLLLE